MTDDDELIGGKTVVRTPLGPGGHGFFLKGLSGVTEGTVHALEGTVTIGRSPKCDILVNDEGISRRHARIECSEQQGCILRDLDSSNGTFVNDRRVDRIHLAPGDKVAFDTVLFEFKSLSEKQARWENVFPQGSQEQESRGSGARWVVVGSILAGLTIAGVAFCWVTGCF